MAKINIWTNIGDGEWIAPNGVTMHGDLIYGEHEFSKKILDDMVSGKIRVISFPTKEIVDDDFVGNIKIRGGYVVFEAFDGGYWKTTYVIRPRNPKAFKRAAKLNREKTIENYVF